MPNVRRTGGTVLSIVRRSPGFHLAAAIVMGVVLSVPAAAQNTPTVLYPPSASPAGSAENDDALADFDFYGRTALPGIPGPPRPKPTQAERERWAERQDEVQRESAQRAERARTLVLRPAVGPTGPSDRLRLSREREERRFEFHVPSIGDVTAAKLVTRFRNAADVLPEHSYLRVRINGEAVARLNAAAVTGFAEVEVDLARRVLKRGRNVMTIEAVQAHRVDCTVAGTYDLWIEVDAANTAVHLRYADGPPAMRTADFNTWLRSGVFSASPVRLLYTGAATAEDRRTWGGYLAQALGARSTQQALSFETDILPAPPADVRVGAAEFAGLAGNELDPGLYVLVGQRETLRPVIGDELAAGIGGPHVSFHDLGSGGARGALIVSGTTAADVTTAAARFAGLGEAPEIAIPAAERAPLVRADMRRTFGELGYTSAPYYGLVYEKRIDFRMPAALFERRGQEGVIDLDYRYGPGLGEDARLLLELNGEVVATEPLDDPDGASVSDDTVRLPTTAFQPGRNTLRVVAELPKPSEEACPLVAADNTGTEPRFQLAESSAIGFDFLSMLYALPDLHTTASTGYPYTRYTAPTRLVVPAVGRDDLGAALTLVAQIRRHADRSFPVRGYTGLPSGEAGHSLVVGSLDSLPEAVLTDAPFSRARIQALTAPPDTQMRVRSAAGESDEPGLFVRWLPEWLVGETTRRLGDNPDFAGFGVIMQGQRGDDSASTRTVLTAAGSDDMARLGELVGRERLWQNLGGAATVFDRTGRNLRVYPPRERYYEAAGRVDVGSAMLIAGEWLSERILAVALGVLIFCMLFGYVLYNLLEATGRGGDDHA